jgi:EAL domain-containing protein (putative c-di-GMP-specific phosphodiesterase class I)
MEQAIAKAGQWNTSYACDLKIGINVSPKQLDDKDFITLLKKIMNDYNILTQWIDIEITESVAIEGEYRIEQIASIFDGVGVSISVDDFGTGYSSLSYLKFFPFERIKIAKPLIDAIATSNYDLQIVKAIVMLAKSIDMKTIAEGVETQEQLDILVELGCDEIQGYLLGRPVPAEIFEQMYLENNFISKV